MFASQNVISQKTTVNRQKLKKMGIVIMTLYLTRLQFFLKPKSNKVKRNA